MKKTTVTICTGTTCYIMGASHLQRLDEVLDPALLEQVEIVGSRCLGYCDANGHGKAPFVKVDDQLIADATLDKVLAQIRKTLAKGAL
ncbi:MAG: NAD(P)H-dependent oxidoreductase subunit E [Kiritimatiellales bacterium]|nr:NAD(P)H-dependent oxidoreductase subunit E [Kiritimatiellales bacterium]